MLTGWGELGFKVRKQTHSRKKGAVSTSFVTLIQCFLLQTWEKWEEMMNLRQHLSRPLLSETSCTLETVLLQKQRKSL